MRKGLVLVNTGLGKGKTTAALGMIFRAWGRGYKICVIQFIKSETGKWGEIKAAENLGIEWHSSGDGFTWLSEHMEETVAKARHGWDLAKEKISSDRYDLILLDEFTYPLHYQWLHSDDVIDWLAINKPSKLHLMITGRYAPENLIEFADLVTEMTQIKHPYDAGIKAQPGIEF